jgi:TetR/AcrR family transcriptional repressor of lmrAB and yxaGH operons
MSAKRPASTRDRILDAATRLFQRRGYHAVGTAEILDEARAPKGSMYHHFPLGKEQIAVAAVARIRDDLLALLAKLRTDGRALDEILRRLAKGITQWMKASDWREGALLSSASIGVVPELPRLHAAIKQAFDAWRADLGAQLEAEGWRRPSAHAMAQTIVASIEGAMILARIDEDGAALITIADTLARLVAAGDPAS